MPEEIDVIVIGAGQAGLSISRELRRAGFEHVVLDRGHVAQSWRNRWESFTLVLPNWTIQLAGAKYAGAEPDAFMPRDEVVQYLNAYAADAPVRTNVDVTSLSINERGRFDLKTSNGPMTARQVVVATGGYQKPYFPEVTTQLKQHVNVIGIDGYVNPQSLPEGKILVIGSAQSGCQIVEDLVLAGRDVTLACGKAPWQPRRIGDRDALAWMAGTKFMEMSLADLPSPMARFGANPQATGRDGGHDLHYRTIQAMGVTMTGHLMGVENNRAVFANDLADSVAFGDARYADLRRVIHESAASRGLAAPDMPDPAPFVADAPHAVELSEYSTAIVACGYRPRYAEWIHVPKAFDDMGFPLQVDGSSTVAEGLRFMGVHYQRKRISATLNGVGEDAGVLIEHMAAEKALT